MIKKAGKPTEIRGAKKASPATPVLIVLGGMVVLAGLALVVHMLSGDETTADATTENEDVTPGVSNRFRCISRKYPLRYGTCHPDVAILQRYLKRQGANLGSTGSAKDGVDAQFGSMTREAALKVLAKEIFTQQEIQALKQKAV